MTTNQIIDKPVTHLAKGMQGVTWVNVAHFKDGASLTGARSFPSAESAAWHMDILAANKQLYNNFVGEGGARRPAADFEHAEQIPLPQL